MQYDAIYLAGDAADNLVLIDYVNAGGNVYLAGGTGDGGAGPEAARWNLLLNTFGLNFGNSYNDVFGTYAMTSVHPLFVGMSGLYYNKGNWITELELTDPNTYTLEYGYFGVTAGLFGIYEPANVLVNLNGSIVDDGLPSPGALTSSWSKVSGSGNVIFANSNSASTVAQFTAPGTYVLRLAASDSEFTRNDDVTITADANRPPFLNAGPDQNIPWLTSATLHGTYTDDGLPTGAPTTYSWKQLSGPHPALFANADALNTSVSFTAAGAYVFRLTATDSQFVKQDDVTINVSVTPANQPPVINLATFQIITLPTNTVTLNATVTDDGFPAGSNVTVTWGILSAWSGDFREREFCQHQRWLQRGRRTSLRITASDGQFASTADINIVVNAPGNQRPTADAGAIKPSPCRDRPAERKGDRMMARRPGRSALLERVQRTRNRDFQRWPGLRQRYQSRRHGARSAPLDLHPALQRI